MAPEQAVNMGWRDFGRGTAISVTCLLGFWSCLSVPRVSAQASSNAQPRIAPGPLKVFVKSAAGDKPLSPVYVRIGGRYAATGADGMVIFDGLPAGDYHIIIEHIGFDRLEKPLSLPPGKREVLALTLTQVVPVTIKGQVTLAGHGGPLAGASIILSPVTVPAACQGRVSLRSTWDGTFQVIELPPGTYRADVSAAGCISRAFDLPVTTGMSEIKYQLEPVTRAAQLDAVARDSITGQPIANAKITLAEAGKRGLIAEAKTDAQGRVEFKNLKLGRLNWEDAKGNLAIARRSVTLLAEADGYEATLINATLDERSNATIRLNPAARINERKPNDELATAQPIVTGAPVEFKIAKVGDKSCFRFHLNYPSAVQIVVGPKNPIETYVRFFNSDGKLLWQNGAYLGSDNILGPGGMPVGEYYVQIEEWNNDNASPNPLTLRVLTTPAPDAHEPNQTMASARVIQSGEEVRGCFLPTGNSAWFRFEVKRPGQIRVVVPAHPLERYLFIRDPAGRILGQWGCYAGAAMEPAIQVSPGVYYLDLHEWNDDAESTVPWMFRLEEIPDDGIDDPVQSPTRRSALRQLPLGGLVGNTIFPVGKVHQYVVSLPSAGRFHADFVSFTELYVTVFTPNGAIATQAGTYPRAPAQVACDVAGPTTLYVQIAEWNNDDCSPWPYILRTWFEPCDEMEIAGRNDSPRQAIPVELNEPIRGSILPQGDVDWYRIEVDHPGHLRVDGLSSIEQHILIRDAKQRVLTQAGFYPNAPIALECEALPGTYFIEVHEWNDDNSSPVPYVLTPRLRRAEPQERVPLAHDPIRTLALGEAQAFWIDFYGDHDRFVFTVPDAGKYTLRVLSPIETYLRLYDDQTGALLGEMGKYPFDDPRWQIDAKGPTRYRLELSEWNDDNYSLSPGFVMIDREGRDFPGEWCESQADPYEPAKVTFTRKALPKMPPGAKMSIDVDGDGKIELELTNAPATWTYKSEGLYRAVAYIDAANGVVTKVPFWVEAIGPQERKGVHVVADEPSEGQLIERDDPVSARALSYSGAAIARISLSIDGQPQATSYSAPHQFDVPWGTLGPGEHELKITATDAKGVSATLVRKVRASEYFDLQPADGATISGNNVQVRWKGAAFGEGKVRYRAKGEANWLEATGEHGRDHAVALGSLEPGKAYEYQPIGGSEPGPVRTVTRVKGLAFGRSKYAATIRRDYDQRLGISVRNHADKPLTVKLECGKPAADSKLLVGFVGDGSEGAPFNLNPGEEREFMLGLSAQDVFKADHAFPVRIASVSGDSFADEATVEIKVILPTVKLVWEDTGPLLIGIGRLLRLHNNGDALTDLSLSTSDPGLLLSPDIRHGLFPAGQSLDIRVAPKLYDGFKSIQGTITASAVDKSSSNDVALALPDGKRVFQVTVNPGQTPDGPEAMIQAARMLAASCLDPASVDWSKKEKPQDLDGDGKMDRWQIEDQQAGVLWVGDDTDGDGEVDFVHADIGMTGQFQYSAFKTAKGWQRTNLVEAWLEMGFALPWDRKAYERHDLDVVMNGVVIGSLRDTIPEGNYSFRIPPSALVFNANGAPEGNTIEIRSKHLRGGHYVVNSDFRIKFRLTGTQLWTVAENEVEANKQVRSGAGVSLTGTDFSINTSELRIEGPAQLSPNQDVAVLFPLRNLGASVPRSVQVALMVAPPGKPPVELSRVTVSGLPPSGPIDVRVPWKTVPGTHVLRVVVDPENVTGDLNRKNNEASITVNVPGTPTKAELTILEPADGQVLKQPVFSLVAQATGTQFVRAEASIDGGLWQPINLADSIKARGLLQPGEHRICLRVFDGAGNAVERAIKLTFDAPRPIAKITQPADAAAIDSRQTVVCVECDKDAVLAAVRVNGGGWIKASINNGVAQATVPLAFGAVTLEALVANSAGVVNIVSVNTRCTRQRQVDDAPQAPFPVEAGIIAVPGWGDVDVFHNPNPFVADK